MKHTCALLVLSTALCHGAWVQLGQTMHEENVTAVSMDFDPDGLPAFAFGYNESAGRTTIPVMAWDGVQWEEDTRRRSQFGQGYHEFDFKVRNSVKYLGLKIHYRFGSVLNGAVEWRGCYAFHNDLFDYDIDSKGNMVMLWVSTLPTDSSYPGTGNKLVLVTYAGAGWNQYPAGNAFGQQTPVAQQTQADRVTDVKIVRGATDDSFVAGYVLGGEVTVFNDSKAANTLGKPWQGRGLDLVHHRTYGTFASYIVAGTQSVGVKRFALDASDWVDMGVAVASSDLSKIKTTLAVTDDGTVVVAAPDATKDTLLHTSTYTIGASNSWALNSFEAAGPITHWDMGANGFSVYIVLSENDGKGVRVVKSDF
eukprot:TRINITY_DN504_c0_g1_i1.p1 TRINITY_DN504_c0_g1~~TRINITY_DN504_c0_g1_i1.p1  ORF type:complete len:366 (+),score=126.69 TRINITY_DN504_c0_g1_i1:644-1741(+)